MLYIIISLAAFFLLYLFMIMPSLKRKPDLAVLKNIYFAHRGFHDNHPLDTSGGKTKEGHEGNLKVPENSLLAFKLAADAGYGVELDIRLSKDNQVVVFHDDSLERICNTGGQISDFTYDELKEFSLCNTNERIPLLTDVLEIVAGQVPLMIEYKIRKNNLSICNIANEILCNYNGKYVIESFHPFVLRWYKKNNPDVIRGQLAEKFTKKPEYRKIIYFLLQNLLFNFLTKPDFIAYNHHHARNWSRILCRKLYHSPAFAWTIRTLAELETAKNDFDYFIFEGFTKI